MITKITVIVTLMWSVLALARAPARNETGPEGVGR